MFPRKCIQPPWRNIDVKTDSRLKSMGTTPYSCDEERQLPIGERQLVEERQRVEGDDRDDEGGEGPGRDHVPKRNHSGFSIGRAFAAGGWRLAAGGPYCGSVRLRRLIAECSARQADLK